MASSAPSEPTPAGPLNWKGVLVGLLFALAVLGGSLATVAASYESEDDKSHSEDGEYSDEGESEK